MKIQTPSVDNRLKLGSRVQQKAQKGLTLIELMIGLTVGIFIVTGATTLYISTLRSSAITIKYTRLTQDGRASMNLITSDLKRAGYWGKAEECKSDSSKCSEIHPDDNPFTKIGSGGGDIRIHDYDSGDANCILYSYDLDNDGTLDSDEIFGFRHDADNGQLDMLQSGLTDTTDCDSGTWEGILDEKMVSVTRLEFSDNGDLTSTEGSKCKDEDDADCYANGYTPQNNKFTQEIYQVDIEMEMELTSDSSVSKTIEGTVVLMNDRMNNDGVIRTLQD